MANRVRKIPIQFYVTERERRIIDENSKQSQAKNLSAYLRNTAINGSKINQEKARKEQCKN